MPIQFAKAIVSILGTVIFFGWVFYSQRAGLAILAASVILTLVTAWAYSNYSIALQIVFFLAIAYVAYYLGNIMQAEARRASMKIEEINKNKNVLNESLSSHKGVQDALKRKLRRFFYLKELMNKLSAQLNSEEVSKAAVDSAFTVIGKADSCYLYLVDTKKQELALTAARQRRPDTKIKDKNGDIFDIWTFKQRQPLIIKDLRKDYRFDTARAPDAAGGGKGTNSLIAAPLVIEGKTVGLIRLNNSRSNSYLQDDLRLLDIISNITSVSLHNAFLYNRTSQLAITDSLTGVYVHKFFKERLNEEITGSLRANMSVCVLLLDIDFFKAYNDTYGHTAGDIVLKKTANILTQNVQDAGDVVARYGGEEFSIILVNKSKQDALLAAEGIRKAVELETFLLRREQTRVTISIGCAACPEDSKISEDLIKLADDALYKAKKSGRNCVMSV